MTSASEEKIARQLEHLAAKSMGNEYVGGVMAAIAVSMIQHIGPEHLAEGVFTDGIQETIVSTNTGWPLSKPNNYYELNVLSEMVSFFAHTCAERIPDPSRCSFWITSITMDDCDCMKLEFIWKSPG